jgi:hypothetical protein
VIIGVEQHAIGLQADTHIRRFAYRRTDLRHAVCDTGRAGQQRLATV